MEDAVLQEGRRKRYACVAFGPGGLKVILELLTKMIAFHVRVAIKDQGSRPSKAYPRHPLGVLVREQGPEGKRVSDGAPCTPA